MQTLEHSWAPQLQGSQASPAVAAVVVHGLEAWPVIQKGAPAYLIFETWKNDTATV